MTTQNFKAYFAGKISKDDWRFKLFPKLAGAWVYGNTFTDRDRVVTENTLGPNLEYAGPWFVACDHGCSHGPTNHGVAANDLAYLTGADGALAWSMVAPLDEARRGGCATVVGEINYEAVFERSMAGIREADVVAVRIGADFDSAHGTHTEIGIARALDKPMVLFVAPEMNDAALREAWFPITASVTGGRTLIRKGEPDLDTVLDWARDSGRKLRVV